MKTIEELAQEFIDLYEDSGCDNLSNEQTDQQHRASNKHWPTYEWCKLVIGK